MPRETVGPSGLFVLQARELWPTCVTLCCAVEMCDAREGGAAPTRPTSKDGSVGAAAPPAQAAGSVAIASAASAGKRARKNKDEDEGNAEQGVGSEQGGENGSESAIIEKYIGFEKAVATMGLGRAWEIAPLVRVSVLVCQARLSCLSCLAAVLLVLLVLPVLLALPVLLVLLAVLVLLVVATRFVGRRGHGVLDKSLVARVGR